MMPFKKPGRAAGATR